jgi:hypothetical protein
MTRTVVTGILDTIDALHQYLPPFDMDGNKCYAWTLGTSLTA